MLFNSLTFVIFYTIVVFLFFLSPHKYRWFILLFASCYFYMYFIPVYILILAFTIVIDYFAGILIENQQDKKRKLKYLIMSLVANIGILAVFKYYNFFNANFSELTHFLGYKNPVPFLSIALPIGLSFHTFQAMSYTIEVYRGHQKAERHFGIYSLYVMFFPQLVAGPIERPQNMLHQFHEKKYFNQENTVTGLRLMMWGLFKKVVIADRLALFTDPVFDNPHAYTSTSICIAALFFSFQIFCDFSGYSDIAIGSARIMGFRLMTNFNKPYHSRDIAEFWKRWHISLSTWFKDYLYIPLGGNRVSVNRTYFNLFLVFLVSGFWHGANWTFIIWGALHGFFLVFGLITKKSRLKLMDISGISKIPWLQNTLNVVSTFLLVTIAWIFFRANNFIDACYMVKKLPGVIGETMTYLKTKISAVNIPHASALKLATCVVVVFILELAHIFQSRKNIHLALKNQPVFIRWAIYYTLIFMILYIGEFHKRQFIYFQF